MADQERPAVEVRGAREHNLKNVDVDIPKKSLVVFTGPSGSGKSSLAFDTIYAEGQRRYVESLSAYARQFLGQMEKPDYDSIRGLAPTIAIEQKSASRNPRSTVGTITEISDYLRVLWARAGKQFCDTCDVAVGRRSVDEIVAAICGLAEGSAIMLLAPKVRERKGEYQELLQKAKRDGFARVRIDGQVLDLDDPIHLDKKRKHTISLVVDRLVIRDDVRNRVGESVEVALQQGDGTMIVAPYNRDGSSDESNDTFYSERLYCAQCDRSFPDLEPNSFSFNAPTGMCHSCNGLGTRAEIDPDRLITDPNLSIGDGAIRPWGALGDPSRTAWHVAYRRDALQQLKVPLDKPWKRLTARQRQLVLFGSDKRIQVRWASANGEGTFNSLFDGVVGYLRRTLDETKSEARKARLAQYFSNQQCSDCQGERLRSESRFVRLADWRLPEVLGLPVVDAYETFANLDLDAEQEHIAGGVLREVQSRLRFLLNVGLGYLTLDRSGPTLSGGEAQRIRLASQIGSELTGVLYVLDEPSIGLHQRDNRRLIETLAHLRDIGNTVLVVEHDEETIRAADYLVDFGPLAGELGGEIVYSGAPARIEKAKRSVTGAYLSGKKAIAVPTERRPGNGAELSVIGASANNLNQVTVTFPLGAFCCLTGVSGAGKSSLLNQIIFPALQNHFHGSEHAVGAHDRIEGLNHLDTMIAIDQQPIGRTPRSNPATYTKVFDEIRKVFAGTREAQLRGFGPGRFSFNVKGGRCEACEGDGLKKVEMHFLPDVFVPCSVCGGKRFNEATLQVRHRGKTIADVLDMSVREAREHFGAHRKIAKILDTMLAVGLDYLRLGQAATTLSGGEAQRIKLSRELAKRSTGKTLYILDEPSTGLHFDDVQKLLAVLHELVDRGNSVIVIEHNLDIIKTADWINDLGPEGGAGGGRLMAAGTPETVAACKESPTGQFLQELLATKPTPRTNKKPLKKQAAAKSAQAEPATTPKKRRTSRKKTS
jgi:excinuclease ABC subunit A